MSRRPALPVSLLALQLVALQLVALLVAGLAHAQFVPDLDRPLDGAQAPRGLFDNCPDAVDFQLCTHPDFIRSPCGQLALDDPDHLCAVLINDAQAGIDDEYVDQAIVSADRLLDLDGRVPRAANPPVRFDGLDGTFLHTVALSGARAGVAVDTTAQEADTAARWRTNCSVQSCDEYVFEKYFDYTSFERNQQLLSDNPRAAFEAIYAADGIANRTLASYTGRPFGAVEPRETRIFQNRFFRYRPWRDDWRLTNSDVVVDWPLLAALGGVIFVDPIDFRAALEGVDGALAQADALRAAVGCQQDADDATQCDDPSDANILNALARPLDPARRAQLDDARPLRFPPRGTNAYTWHRQQSDLRDDIADERLLWLDDVQNDFAIRLDERARLQRDISDVALGLFSDMVDPRQEVVLENPALFARQQARLQRLIVAYANNQLRIDEHLDTAETQGCLRGDAVTACDWSPRWLVDDVAERFVDNRATDYQRCTRITADDFRRMHDPDPGDNNPNWLKAWAARNGDFCRTASGERVCQLLDTYIADTSTVEAYFEAVEAWFASLRLPRDPETGELYVGESAGEYGVLGDSRFGVVSEWSANYRVDIGGAPCADTAQLLAHLDIGLRAFGLESFFGGGSLLNANLVTPNRNAGQRFLDVTLLGEDLAPDVFEGNDLRFHYTDDAAQDGPSLSAEKTFWAGFIPFTFRGGIAGQVGIKSEIDGGRSCVNRGLVAHTTVKFTPYATASAFAEGLLGVPGANLGVRTDLTLVRTELPLTLEFGLDSGLDRLNVGARLDWVVTFLKGRVSLVAELLFASYSKRLFGWGGIEWKTPLFKAERFPPQMPLGELRRLLNEDPIADVSGEAAPGQFFDAGLSCHMPAPVPEPDLYLDFDDENVAADALNASIGDRALPFVQAPGTGREGIHGQAFDTLSGGLATDGLPAPQAGFTLGVWFRRDANGVGTVLANDAVRIGVDDRDLVIEVDCGTGRRTWRRNNMLSYLEFDSTFISRWHFVAITFDPEGIIFVDLDGNNRLAAGCEQVPHMDGRLTIGHRGPGWFSVFPGRIDELSYFTRALTRATRSTLFTRVAAGRPVAGEGAARPTGVEALRVDALEERVLISWDAPPSVAVPGEGFDAMRLVARMDDFPRSSEDGVFLSEGDETGASHDDLRNGDRWYYTLFLQTTDGRWLRGPSATATPRVEPPPPVENVRAIAQRASVRLEWTEPDAPDVAGVTIRRAIGREPLLTDNIGLLPQTPGWVVDDDERLTPLVEHTYGLWTFDSAGNYSIPVFVRATPLPGAVDLTPPPPVAGLRVESGDRRLILRWQPAGNAGIADAGIIVRRAGPQGVTLRRVPDNGQLIDDGLINDAQYLYTVERESEGGVRSRPRQVRGFPGRALPAVEAVQARLVDGAVRLTWDAPTDAVWVARQDGALPLLDPAFGAPGRIEGAVYDDAAIDLGATYTYTVFTLFPDGRFGPPVWASIEVPDNAPPPPVSALSALAGPGQVQLGWWRDPARSARVIVRGRLGPAPVEVDGELRFAGAYPAANEGIEVYAGPLDSVQHTELEAGQTWYYGVYAQDVDRQLSSAAKLAVVVAADPGPVLRVDAPPRATVDAPFELSARSVGDGPVSTTWTQLDGPPAELFGADTDRLTVAARAPGLLRLRCQITDADGRTASAEVQVRIEAGDVALATPWPLPFSERRGDGEHLDVRPWRNGLVALRVAEEAIEAVLYDGDATTVRVVPRAGDMHVDGDRLYLRHGQDPTTIVDLAAAELRDPYAPPHGGLRLAAFGGGRALYLSPAGDTLHIAEQDADGLVGRFDGPNPGGNRGVAIGADAAYVLDANAVTRIDISDPAAPVFGDPVALPDMGQADGIWADADYVVVRRTFIDGVAEQRQLVVLDADLNNPRVLAPFEGLTTARLIDGMLFVQGADARAGWHVFDLATGERSLWTVPLAAPTGIAPDAQGWWSAGPDGLVSTRPVDQVPPSGPFANRAPALTAPNVLLGPNGLTRIDGAAEVAHVDAEITANALVRRGAYAYALNASTSELMTWRVEPELAALGAVMLPFGCTQLFEVDDSLWVRCPAPAFQVIDLSDPAAPALGPARGEGAFANLAVIDAAAGEYVLVGEGSFERRRLADDTVIAAGTLQVDPDQFIMWFNLGTAAAAYHAGRLHIVIDGAVLSWDLLAGDPAPVQRTPIDDPGVRSMRWVPGIERWLTVGAQGLSVWQDRPGHVLMGRMPLPAEALGPDPAVLLPDQLVQRTEWIANARLHLAGAEAGLLTLPLRPVIVTPTQTTWPVTAARSYAVPDDAEAVECRVSTGTCAVQPGPPQRVIWRPADPGPATIDMRYGNSGHFWRVLDTVILEAP